MGNEVFLRLADVTVDEMPKEAFFAVKCDKPKSTENKLKREYREAHDNLHGYKQQRDWKAGIRLEPVHTVSRMRVTLFTCTLRVVRRKDGVFDLLGDELWLLEDSPS